MSATCRCIRAIRAAPAGRARSLTGLFGLGTVRTLGDFHALSGIDYEHRTIV
jgi:hypothetical protein